MTKGGGGGMAYLNTRLAQFILATSMHYYILDINTVLVKNFWGFTFYVNGS